MERDPAPRTHAHADDHTQERDVDIVTLASRSEPATESLGEQIGRALTSPALIALDGQLGAGKTAFVRGLARGLDIRDTISSPTYALLQTYTGRLDLHHLDAWMEGRERAFLSDGGLEWVAGSGVTVIEWAERVADFLPLPHMAVRIDVTAPQVREITVRVRRDPHVRGAADRALQNVLAALRDGPDLVRIPT